MFCQLIVISLFNDQKLLTQVAGHGNHTIKLLPTLTISEEDCAWIEQLFDAVIAAAHGMRAPCGNMERPSSAMPSGEIFCEGFRRSRRLRNRL